MFLTEGRFCSYRVQETGYPLFFFWQIYEFSKKLTVWGKFVNLNVRLNTRPKLLNHGRWCFISRSTFKTIYPSLKIFVYSVVKNFLMSYKTLIWIRYNMCVSVCMYLCIIYVCIQTYIYLLIKYEMEIFTNFYNTFLTKSDPFDYRHPSMSVTRTDVLGKLFYLETST